MPLSLSSSIIGSGWRELEIGDELTTLTQSYLPDKGVWVDATYLTSDGYFNRGRMNYRVPVSIWAHVKALWGILPKLWRRKVLGGKW